MYGEEQFERIIEFMAGIKTYERPEEEWEEPGLVKSMILVYEGKDAISKIRTILGATDPTKQPPERSDGSSVQISASIRPTLPTPSRAPSGRWESSKWKPPREFSNTTWHIAELSRSNAPTSSVSRSPLVHRIGNQVQ